MQRWMKSCDVVKHPWELRYATESCQALASAFQQAIPHYTSTLTSNTTALRALPGPCETTEIKYNVDVGTKLTKALKVLKKIKALALRAIVLLRKDHTFGGLWYAAMCSSLSSVFKK